MCAQYLPPSEDLPIFDDSAFQTNNTPLTYSQAITKFLAYPNAQGTETLQAVNVNGTATFLNNAIFQNGTTTFQENVIIENQSNGTVRTLTFDDPQSGKLTTITNSAGSMNLITSSTANAINHYIGGSNLLTLTNTSLTTSVPLPASSDNTNKIATTAFVQSVPAKPATALTVVLNNTSATSYTIPMCAGQASGTYTPINICNQFSFQPSTSTLSIAGTIATQILNASQPTPGGRVLNVLNGGLFMLWNPGTSQYCQITNLADPQNAVYVALQIDPTYGVYFNMNQQGLVGGTTTAGLKPRLEIGCSQGGASEIDLCSSSATGTGGFNFYNKSNTSPLTLIGKIPTTQPATSDSSQNLATTAWTQSTLLNYLPKLTFFAPAPINPSGTLTETFAIINNIPQSAFTQVSGVIPPSYKFRISFDCHSTDYLIAYSFSGVVDIYPSRLTNTNPVVAGTTQFTGGNITTNNLTNAIAGLSTTYNYTNATYSPYNRFYWVSCQNGGFFSGGNTTWLYIYAFWSSAVGGTSNLTLNHVVSGYNASPTALNPTNGFSLAQTAMFNYTTEYLGTNVAGGNVILY